MSRFGFRVDAELLELTADRQLLTHRGDWERDTKRGRARLNGDRNNLEMFVLHVHTTRAAVDWRQSEAALRVRSRGCLLTAVATQTDERRRHGSAARIEHAAAEFRENLSGKPEDPDESYGGNAPHPAVGEGTERAKLPVEVTVT